MRGITRLDSGTVHSKRLANLPSFDYIFKTIIKIQHQWLFSTFKVSSCSYPSSSRIRFVGKDTASIAVALKLANSKSSDLGTQVHGHVIKLGFSNDVFSQNNLINMYSKCGNFVDGLKMFYEMPEINHVSWSSIISGAIHNGEYKFGLVAYLGMMKMGFMSNEFALGSVMKVCTGMGVFELGLCIHCCALKSGMEKNPFVGTSILDMYARFGVIEASEKVFNYMESSDVGCWNAMIGGYAKCGYGFEAMKTVFFMHSLGVHMDELTFVNTLSGCSIVGDLDYGRQIHGLIIRIGVVGKPSVMNALMDMYFRISGKDHALRIFYAMQEKDVVSWNIAFLCSSRDVDAREVANLFHNFMSSNLKPICVTFSVLFRICGEVHNLYLGLQFFCLSFHFGFHSETLLVSSLIGMFSRCEALEMARFVFDCEPLKNINHWNDMISGYSLAGDVESLKLFRKLWDLGVEANECTFSTALEGSFRNGNLRMGRQIHGIVVKMGFALNGYICSALIKGYTRFGFLDDSFEFFSGSEELDIVCQASMISELVHQGFNSEAIIFFNCLIYKQVVDEFMLSSILNSCAIMASYHLTQSVHSLVIKMGFKRQVYVSCSVLDAYAKCGDIESAKIAFYESSKFPDVALFNAMIMAYAHHGLLTEAMEIFQKMEAANLIPSQGTFVSVISACSHMGLVDLGRTLFESISLVYGMEPSADNYGCLVDLLARNGLLEDAKHKLETMPFSPWPAILRALLNGCRIHGNRELGEWAAEKLFQLVPDNDAAYILLSKVYSEDGNWEDATDVRKGMIERGVQKDLGCSWIEL